MVLYDFLLMNDFLMMSHVYTVAYCIIYIMKSVICRPISYGINLLNGITHGIIGREMKSMRYYWGNNGNGF